MNLERYGVVQVESHDGPTLSALENAEILLPIIHEYANYLETKSLSIAASLFFKRYAVSVAAASLDYFDFQGNQLNWLDNATFDSQQFKIFLSNQPLLNMEECWKERVFYNHLQKIVQILSKECRINQNILWENVAVRLNAVLKKNQDFYTTEKVQSIFEQLTDSNPTWFCGQENPLKPFCQTCDTKRKTCCRYYLLDKKEEGVPYCLVCPLKKD